jgi:hypothetical protein
MFVLSFFLVTPGVALADNPATIPNPPLVFPNSRTIMIFDKGLDTHILSIDRYTEVMLINDSHSAVKIEFEKGPNYREISAAAFPALGIRMQPDRCFITSPISPKGTLRFRFKEFGDYHYEVNYIGTNRVDHGELKVF